jgi:hypothetical protein
MTPLLLWILRLLVLLLIVRLIVRGVSSVIARRTGSPAGRPGRSPERLGGHLVRDPQCGTYIPESRAIVVGRGQDAQHFCSPTCRDSWLASHGARVKA